MWPSFSQIELKIRGHIFTMVRSSPGGGDKKNEASAFTSMMLKGLFLILEQKSINSYFFEFSGLMDFRLNTATAVLTDTEII